MKLRYLATIAVAAAFMLTGAANAAMLNLVSGVNIFEDDNVEYIIGADGEIRTTGTLGVGDTLVAVITFTTLESETQELEQLGAPGKEVTGLSYIEIKAIVDGVFIFGPSAAFEATYGDGAMAALFIQDPGNLVIPDCTQGPDVNTCIANAIDGDPYLVAGFADADDFWTAVSAQPLPLASLTLDFVKNTAATVPIATATYALSILENNTGYELGQQTDPLIAFLSSIYGQGPVDERDGFVDIIGQGSVLGGSGLGGDWVARSDFDFQVYRVPEPATLGLLGLGLVALGFAAARRRTGTA